MTRDSTVKGEKPLHFVGSALKDLQDLSVELRQRFGRALGAAQFGLTAAHTKPWKGDGPGVMEVVEDLQGDTFRAVYTVRFADAVYVLHVFQKKSKRGIKTPRPDQEMITRRLRAAAEDYKERYGEDRED